MAEAIHITNGDAAAALIKAAGFRGEMLAWNDLIYDGPPLRPWPDDDQINARARFLSESTGGKVSVGDTKETLLRQYASLESGCASSVELMLWFDACLFDQAVLVHVLACVGSRSHGPVILLVVDSHPGINPFNGLGQLTPERLASRHAERTAVGETVFSFAAEADRAFAGKDKAALETLATMLDAPLPHIPPAAKRLLAEMPDPATGLGRLETLILEAVNADAAHPGEIFKAVAAADISPQFWGDTTLWAKINGLATRQPPLLTISGPSARLPQWSTDVPLRDFRITLAE